MGFGAQLLKQIGIPGFVIVFIGIVLLKYVYRITFHPLASYPGPKIAALTRLWYSYHLVNGTLVEEVRRLHDSYGTVIRIAPDELAVTSSSGWKDIYGFRRGKPEMSKDTPWYKDAAPDFGILSADREKHAYYRRLMSRGFSDAALQEQEPIVQSYADLLMSRLHDISNKGEPAEMTSWYNFFTFDIIGDLAFGEPFGCLETSSYHPWVKTIFSGIRFLTITHAMAYYPILKYLVPTRLFQGFSRNYQTHNQMTKEKAMHRKESKLDRADFVSNLCKPESNISDKELIDNSSILIIAGSETTATVLSAATWFLTQNPECRAKLTQEIRSTFGSRSQISFDSVNRLPYLLAFMNESLRLFPPAPTGLTRKVPEGGDEIDGRFVAGGNIVAIFPWAINLSPQHWTRPTEFIPERWMDDSRFKTDDLSVMQVFSYGPRNCIGKNLAYVEMRLIMARMVFEFDIEPCEGMEDWNQAKIFTIWAKNPLWVNLKSVA